MTAEIPIGDVQVGSGAGPAIGRISWFSVRSFELSREVLLSKWVEAGLTEGEFLPATRPCDAYKQATKMVEDKIKVSDTTITRYILRHQEGRPNVRHVIRELLRKGEDKPFGFEDIGRFTFKDEGTPVVEGIWHGPGEADEGWLELVAMVKARYETLLTVHDDLDIRLVLARKLRKWHSLLLRPTGGVYFIPKDFAPEAEAYAKFLRLVGSEMWALVVTAEATPMVRQKVEEYKAEAAQAAADKLAKAEAEVDPKKKQTMTDAVTEEKKRVEEMVNYYGQYY